MTQQTVKNDLLSTVQWSGPGVMQCSESEFKFILKSGPPRASAFFLERFDQEAWHLRGLVQMNVVRAPIVD